MQVIDITVDTNHAAAENFVGFSIHESDGTPAVAAVTLRKAAVDGQILAHIELAANESATLVFPRILSAEDGVYVQVVDGTISGVLYHE